MLYPRFSYISALALILLFTSPRTNAAWTPPWVAACPVFRNANLSNATESFNQYRDSYAHCGVKAKNLPYIVRGSSSAPRLGTVVLVHGLTASPAHMREIADYLAQSGYNVVVPLLYGHGGSDAMLAATKKEQWTADVSFAGKIAGRLGGPLFLMGHSTGGTLSALEAARNPDLYRAVVAIDPPLKFSGRAVDVLTKLSCFASQFPGNSYESDIIPRTIAGRPFETTAKYVNVRIGGLVKAAKEYCDPQIFVPEFNDRLTLRGVCSMANSAREVSRVDPWSLPATLAVLTADEKLYGGKLDRQKTEDFIRLIPGGRVHSTSAPDHALVLANCNPEFYRYMTKVRDFLADHGGSGQAASVKETQASRPAQQAAR